MSKIPVTVITGFLGAGKTTLIRHLLGHAKGKRIALIINEFGDLGVDKEVLAACGHETCREEDMIELSNGCICCTVGEDFIPAMETLLGRAERPDHIIIETSGLALPQPLIRAFNWPEIKSQVTIDGVVTVVDAAALSEGRFAADEQAVARQRVGRRRCSTMRRRWANCSRTNLMAADLHGRQQDRSRGRGDVLDAVEARLARRDAARNRHDPRQNGHVDIAALLGLGLATRRQSCGPRQRAMNSSMVAKAMSTTISTRSRSRLPSGT